MICVEKVKFARASRGYGGELILNFATAKPDLIY